MMSNYNQSVVNELVSKRHVNVCKSSAAYTDNDQQRLPNVIADLDSHPVEMSEDAHGHVVLRVWAECQDCSRSGYTDIPYSSGLLKQANRKAALPPTDAANAMGGGDVSDQYITKTAQ